MSKKNEINVYWSPWWQINQNVNYDIFYHEPQNVYLDISKNFTPPTETKNFIQCPAVMNMLSKHYVIFSKTDIDLTIDIDENGNIKNFGFSDPQKTAIGGTLAHSPTLNNQFLIELSMSLLFFSEESLKASIMSPFFHKTPHSNYGAIVPGEFDIGKWFRPINLEFNMWPNETRLKIDSEEPLAYINFNTDSKIIFKRFSFNQKLFEIAATLVRYKDKPRWRNLDFRYKRFEESSMKKIIMKEIGDNLVE